MVGGLGVATGGVTGGAGVVAGTLAGGGVMIGGIVAGAVNGAGGVGLNLTLEEALALSIISWICTIANAPLIKSTPMPTTMFTMFICKPIVSP